MTFLYEVWRLTPENIKTKPLLKTNSNKMRVSLGACDKIRKFKNTYTQDSKQLFQNIGQIHGAMLQNIDLFTLSCC